MGRRRGRAGATGLVPRVREPARGRGRLGHEVRAGRGPDRQGVVGNC
jgi:hypothetical protein